MIAFVLGVTAACVCVAMLPGLADVWLTDEPAWYAARWSGSLALLCCVQALASALGAIAVHALSPRAMFASGRWGAWAFALGATSGLISGGLALVLVAAMLRHSGGGGAVEAGIAGASACAASAGVLLFARRHRADMCPGCGYDVHMLTTASRGRCPECGRDHFALRYG